MLALVLTFPHHLAKAQEDQPPGPVYVVQEGDSIWSIAQRFSVSVQELAGYNRLDDPGRLAVGAQLVIPGMPDVQGVLVTRSLAFGENLLSLSRRYHLPVETIARLNNLTSPNELYGGANIILPESSAALEPTPRTGLAPGQSLLELAVVHGANPWSLVRANQLQGTWQALPADVLRLPEPGGPDGPGALPAAIGAVEVEPIPLVQGGTAVLRLHAQGEISLGGSLLDRELHFFKYTDGSYISLQGVHAMTAPGFYLLTLTGELEDGLQFSYSQRLFVRDGGYHYETLVVPPETLDPANTEPEDALWNSLAVARSPERLWEGPFRIPVISATAETCYSSLFGNRRSYNGSPFRYFHTGLDFCYNYNLEVNEIDALAAGLVVFAGELTVRGNATVIDHGWGVYSAYMHQKEILVEEGQRVAAGQVIGVVGGTGRVSGPHLHLEIWVGEVQVDPMDWLEREYP